MAEVSAEKLIVQLLDMAAKAREEGNPVVAVEFKAAYALWVHENMEMKWKGLSRDPRIRRIEQGGDPALARSRPRKREPRGRYWDPQGRGQSKFLETPLRQGRQKMAEIALDALRQGKTMAQALLLAGLWLLREAQRLVPVDTTDLKNSGVVELE